MATFVFIVLFISLQISFIPSIFGLSSSHVCRSYCGNITIDYPFSLQPGCGHSGFRDLLFCINNVLMFHISSGSYRVLNIDYAYESMILHDPHLSTCDSIVLGGRGNGFVVEHWRAPYLNPTPDNVFMLLGCSAQSPLFQGFPTGEHVPCRNVSGMSCQEYYGCRAWNDIGLARVGLSYGSGPPICCALPFEAIKGVNLSKLECQGYSSAYTLAPLRVSGPSEWTYGIRVKYSVEMSNDSFCKACEATSGSCGHDVEQFGQLCMCGSRNSTSNCDTIVKLSVGGTSSTMNTLSGLLIVTSIFWIIFHQT